MIASLGKSVMLSVLMTLVLSASPDVRWTGFLGADAVPLPAESLPVEWSPDKLSGWKTPLPGHAQSSPVIWDNVAYTISVSGPEKNTYHVFAVALKDGAIQWTKTVESTAPVKNSVYVSRAAPTPVVDADGVYVFFESGDFASWTHAGELRWQRSLTKDYGPFDNEFGLAASPVVWGDRVIQLIDHGGPSYLLAVSKATGETLWKTDRASRRSWSSPRLVTVAGKPQIIISSTGSVDGYDPESGAQLWTFSEVGGNTSTTPIPAGDGRVIISASTARDGENAELAKRSNLLLEVRATESGYEPHVIWRAAEANPSFCSPCVHEGYAYWLNRAGIVYCIDLATGEQKYAKRCPQGGWATPYGCGDHIYIFGKDGLTTVLKAGPEYEVIAENQLWTSDDTYADPDLTPETEGQRQRSAAMLGGRSLYGYAAIPGFLLIRTGDRLYGLRKE